MMTAFFRQLERLPERAYKPGDTLIGEKAPSRGIFFLMNGTVEVIKNERKISEISKPGSIFGEMSYLLTVLPTATVKALTPCRFRVCENPTTFLSEHAEVALFMANNLAQRLDALNTHMVDFKTELSERLETKGLKDEFIDLLNENAPR